MMDLQSILELSDVEKILITEKICDSIDKNNYQVPQSHKDELDRRIERIDSGKEIFFTWAEVKNEILNAIINIAREQIKNGEFFTQEQADTEFEKWVKK